MNITDFYQKLDQHFAQHDTKALEDFMIRSLTDARTENDPAAIVAVSNELAGFYRAAGNVDEAIKLSQKVLQLLKNMGEETSENFAVALQNGANVMMVAKDYDTALQMFRTAESILVYRGFDTDYRMAALSTTSVRFIVKWRTSKRQRKPPCVRWRSSLRCRNTESRWRPA